MLSFASLPSFLFFSFSTFHFTFLLFLFLFSLPFQPSFQISFLALNYSSFPIFFPPQTMSNSQNILLSDKDLNSSKSFSNFPACRAPIRTSLPNRQSPARNCRIESDSSEDGNRKRRKQPAKDDDDSGAEEKENIYKAGAGRPSELKRRDYVDENDDGFKTPTSLDQKIPATPACPPPPRKPKPPPSMKRRAPRRRVLLDLSNEIELLFPPAILADLGNNVKKIRQAN